LHRPDAEVQDLLMFFVCAFQVEEGCGLATADDIAAAVHQLLCFIDAETTSRRLLELHGGRPDLQS
jgi:predicted transcriptional regulator